MDTNDFDSDSSQEKSKNNKRKNTSFGSESFHPDYEKVNYFILTLFNIFKINF